MSKFEDNKFYSKTKSSRKCNFNGHNPANLKSDRIVQKHLVYIIGLSYGLANKEILLKTEYLGQYGTITKIVVNKNKAYNPDGHNGPTYSAYVTFSSAAEASIAILSLDNITADGHLLRASFGTTKYCSFFLKNFECPNRECLYLHHMAYDHDIVYKDDLYLNKNVFYEQQILAIKLSDLYSPEIRKKMTNKRIKSVFPSTDTLYAKEIVFQNEPNSNKYPVGGNSISNTNNYNSNSNFECKTKKKYEYDDKNYYDDDTEKQEEEIEYVLVREKDLKYRRYNKKYQNFKKSENYKPKSEEDYNEKKTNSNSENKEGNGKEDSNNKNFLNHEGKKNSQSETESTRKKESILSKHNYYDENINKANILENSKMSPKKNNFYTPEKKLYRKREISRFGFAKTENKSPASEKEVPEFVSEMFYKKLSRFTFFKKFTCVKDLKNDFFYFEKELKNNNNSWAEFITSTIIQ